MSEEEMKAGEREIREKQITKYTNVKQSNRYVEDFRENLVDRGKQVLRQGLGSVTSLFRRYRPADVTKTMDDGGSQGSYTSKKDKYMCINKE